MNSGGFGALRRIRTCKHIRTVRSIPTGTGLSGAVYRDQETVHLRVQEKGLKAWQVEHEKRRAIQRLLHGR